MLNTTILTAYFLVLLYFTVTNFSRSQTASITAYSNNCNHIVSTMNHTILTVKKQFYRGIAHTYIGALMKNIKLELIRKLLRTSF